MKPLRSLPREKNNIFLTFDDGPCPTVTPQVLDVLDEMRMHATFFVIGKQAFQFPEIIRDILKRGHSLGNHSWDHNYAHFFSKEKHLKDWVFDSHQKICQKFGVEPVGFRSPAGIVTPPLMRVIQELEMPWIHWNQRFFDTSVPLAWTTWTYSPADGDILLLHDAQRTVFQKSFLKSLRRFLTSLKDKGFDFPSLKKEKF